MAARSFFLSLKRSCNSSSLFHVNPQTLSRSLASGAQKADLLEQSTSSADSEDDLKSRIFRLRFSKRSATNAIQRWIGEGRTVTLPELRKIAKDLNRAQRYKHALEILTWMEEAQDSFKISAADHAIRLELVLKVCNLYEAEKYFANIPDRSSQKAACIPLLHQYVKQRDTGRAESFMSRLQALGLTVTPHSFNEMMKLYIATGHFKMVPLVIQQMKHNRVPRNVLSYNLWMSGSYALSGVPSVEIIYKEMLNDKTVKVGWSTDATLANFYIRAGFFDKAYDSLRSAEVKLSTKNRLGYFFLITLYASLQNKDGVLRLWEASKEVPGRTTCANYMCVLLCLVKLGEIREAERVFETWESECRNYDVRVSNVLLGAYMRNGWMEKAEALYQRALLKGGNPNYKTWEILMEGWVKRKEMGKAIEAMKKGFAMLEDCDVRPPPSLVMAVLEYYEEIGSVDDAMGYVKVLRRLKLADLAVYKKFLGVVICAKKPTMGVVEMMKKERIEWDEETLRLVQSSSVMNGVKYTIG